MRILALQETDWIRRNPIMHHRMLEELSRRGDEVTVIDYDLHWREQHRGRLTLPRRTVTGFSKYYSDSSITLIRPAMLRLPGLSRLTWLAANWRELRRILARHRPDVIIGYGISNALLGAVMARRAGVPFVFHLLDALHTLVEPAPARGIARKVEAMALRRADEIIVINSVLGKYAESMGADPSRISIVPVGHTPRLLPAEASGEVRRSLGVNEGEFLLVFVGWLYPFSGLRELIGEFAIRKHQFPSLKIAIVGTGDLYAELQAMRDRHLESQLLMVGQRPVGEIAGYIAAADACLLPALRHPAMEHIVPAKVGEYMELGKPVIMTRLPALLAEFSDLGGALWIDHPADALDHVARFAATADARAEARAAGQTAMEFAALREDWHSVIERFRRLLATCGESGGGPPAGP